MVRAEILRDGKTVKLDEPREELGGAHFPFAPLYEVWKKPISAQWVYMPTRIDGAEQK